MAPNSNTDLTTFRPFGGGADDDQHDQELLSQVERIAELSGEEVDALETDLVAAFEDADGESPDLERMQSLAAAIGTVRENKAERAQAAAAAQEQAEQLRAQVNGDGEGEGEGDGSEGAEGTEGEGTETETQVETPGGTEVTETQTPAGGDGGGEGAEGGTQAAGRTPVRTQPRPTPGSIQRPAANAPTTPQAPTAVITAGGDVPDHSAGSILTPDELGEAFAAKVDSLMGTKGGAYRVGTVRTQFPEDRSLVASGVEVNTERVETAFRELEERMQLPPDSEAILAAGGLCAPVAASYSLARISEGGRPVRDSLTRFGAERGGIRFITPPRIGDLASGVTEWTAAHDVDPTAGAAAIPATGPATKPCVTISCGAEVTVTINAVPLCIKVGNFTRRTFPEQFEAWYELALAAHDRFAEGRMLDRIYAGSVKITEARVLGVARDIIEQAIRIGAAYRSRHRMNPDATLSGLFPMWVLYAMAADRVRELPSGRDLVTTRAEVEGYLRAANIEPTFYLDSRTGGNQIYPDQGAGAGLAWKGTAEWAVFHPGAWLFLDGGQLDLGVDIRDSALISTNDVKAFMETFENVAFQGIESLWVTSTICVSGHAAAAATVACA